MVAADGANSRVSRRFAFVMVLFGRLNCTGMKLMESAGETSESNGIWMNDETTNQRVCLVHR